MTTALPGETSTLSRTTASPPSRVLRILPTGYKEHKLRPTKGDVQVVIFFDEMDAHLTTDLPLLADEIGDHGHNNQGLRTGGLFAFVRAS